MSNLPWTWLAIRASGLTSWALLTAVVVWGILLRTRILNHVTTPVRLLDLHRWLGATALSFLAIHLAFLLIDPSVKFTVTQILVPGLAPWNTLAVAFGTIAFWLLIPVTILGRLRSKMGKAGNTIFKRAHLIAYAAWPIATAHYVLAGTDAMAQWSLGLLIAGSTVIVLGLIARGYIPAPAPTRAPAPSGKVTIPSA
ncbi:MAG: hypothetical protein WCG77_02375 [Actinomycetes bacterium]|jgi:predicted ferric reductase